MKPSFTEKVGYTFDPHHASAVSNPRGASVRANTRTQARGLLTRIGTRGEDHERRPGTRAMLKRKWEGRIFFPDPPASNQSLGRPVAFSLLHARTRFTRASFLQLGQAAPLGRSGSLRPSHPSTGRSLPDHDGSEPRPPAFGERTTSIKGSWWRGCNSTPHQLSEQWATP